MPDTGAPHFIPFADPTDLVRDWPALSEDVAEAVAAGLSAAGNAGIGSNVVSVTKTDVFSASVATATEVAITNFEVTITPSSVTSKVLVMAQLSTASSSEVPMVTLYRGATPILIGDAQGDRSRRTLGGTSAARVAGQAHIAFLDAPNTDEAVTYSVRVSHTAAGSITFFVNRGTADADLERDARTTSTLTAIEVAA